MSLVYAQLSVPDPFNLGTTFVKENLESTRELKKFKNISARRGRNGKLITGVGEAWVLLQDGTHGTRYKVNRRFLPKSLRKIRAQARETVVSNGSVSD